ncbi:hypothetical protein DNTS_001722 [Danionella cerebrum]|uniref:BHLH domain-containing protein n=1 Tax=Danionella cerebrum TaxID=2873325 RepID=A0A553QUW8_9TELE|nr:hypothetical protein DNTS_001722 [Danionella translucida]
MPEIVQHQSNNPKRRKKNKEIHNAVERHRKEKINAGINRIGEILPCSQTLKQSKNMILGEAFRYITELKRQNDEMLLNGGDKVQAEEIKRLRHQLEDLRKESAHYIELLKANDINFMDDPTIHWKGKQRCAKVAKIPPSHLSKGIIVYSNGNNSCPINKVSISPNAADQQPTKAVTPHPSSDITKSAVGTPVNMPLVSSTSSHIPVATLIPAVSKPCLTVVKQSTLLASAAPKLNPSMNYITLQRLCPQPAVTTSQLQAHKSTPSLSSETCPSAQHILSLTSLPQVVMNNSVVPAAVTTILNHCENQPVKTMLPASATLRTNTTSSTQTTWTTLQLAGNTVHPVSQTLAADGGNMFHNNQQMSVSPMDTKRFDDTIAVRLQPPKTVEHPSPTRMSVQPSGQNLPQFYSAIVPCPQAALSQHASILSLPAIVSQAAVVHSVEAQMLQSGVRSQPTLLPKPQHSCTPMTLCNPTIPSPVRSGLPFQPNVQTTIMPQPQSLVPQLHLSVLPQAQPVSNATCQPAPVPQQAAPLPVLQAMQLLQVNSDETPVVTSSPPSKSHVVILQQGSSCPKPQVLREDVASQTPCQHIVIIQAPTLTPAAQSHPTAIVSSGNSNAFSQTCSSVSTCANSVPAANAKQLVQILPRPTNKLHKKAPQTITVNGQVYVLQTAKSPEKGSTLSSSVNKPTNEDASPSLAMNSLDALSSLSQSISNVSSQSSAQIYSVTPPLYTTISVNSSEISTSAETDSSVPVSPALAVNVVKIQPPQNSGSSGKNAVKKNKMPKRQEPKSGSSLRRIAVKSKMTESYPTSSESFTAVTDVDYVNSSRKVSNDCNQQSTSNSTISTCNSSTITTFASSSDKSTISSISSQIVSMRKLPNTGRDLSMKMKAISDVVLPENAADSTVTTGSSSQSNDVSSSSGSSSKDVLNESMHASAGGSAVLSQRSSLDTVSLPVDVNSSSIGGNFSIREAELRPSSSTSVTTMNESNTKIKAIHSDHSQSQVSNDCSPQRQLPCINSVETRQILPSSEQTASQTQNKCIRKESLTKSNEIPTTYGVPSSSASESDTSRPFSDPSKSLKQPSLMIPPTATQLNLDFKVPKSNELNGPGADVVTEKRSLEVIAFDQTEAIPQQQICTVENHAFEAPLGTSRQGDSLPAGVLGGKGFSVASLLPAGNTVSAASSTFNTFTFTSEHAEILAMAIFEQDSPVKSVSGCSEDNPANSVASGWNMPKVQPAPLKENQIESQVKLSEQANLPMAKASSQVSEQATPVEPLGSCPSGVRHPQSIAYSQSQPSTVTSLNVNNLIRPSSNQSYPGSPNLVQQVSAPPSGGAATMASSSQNPPSCSVSSHPNEYAPLKSALMRTHAGVGIVERHQKEMLKRSTQDNLNLPNKRSKTCTVGNMARVDKAAEHPQMMAGQMPSSTTAAMPRSHSDGVGALFSENTFMSTVLRPAEGHCSAHEPNQPNVVHLQQGQSQHNLTQSGQNMGINPYLNQPQQQEQRNLYQLQHHLTQPESQIHGIHQRNLMQEQHVQKKRGVGRGGQTEPNAALQKHLEKSSMQQQQQHQHQQHHHQQQSLQQQKLQHIQQQQQSHQPQQQMPPQNSRQQQMQQQQQHFGARQNKNCDQQAGQRPLQNSHLGQQERPSGQDHGTLQRLMGSRSMEQQLTSQASNSVSRSSDLNCTSRQERQRLSSYSAEALIGKSPATAEQRMGMHLHTPRNNAQDQPDLRGYVDSSRGKGNLPHNSQTRLLDHANTADAQRLTDCVPFKAMPSGHQLGNFEVQVSRSSDLSSKPVPQIQRGPQAQAGFRMGAGPVGDGRSRGTYSGSHPVSQGLHVGAGLTREQEGCHQSFMQSLLAPHVPEQNGHQRAVQGCTPVSMEYSSVPGASAGDLQAKSSSPNLHPGQKGSHVRIGDKGHISQVGANLHGAALRTGPPHPATPHSSSDTGRSQGSTRTLSVSQRPHHVGPDPQSTKIRPGERPRTGTLRSGNPFETESPLPLPSAGGVILGRTQTGSESRRSSIVRFMADSAPVTSENNFVSDRCAMSDLTQNFGFSFIAEGGMNPPPVNANASLIPPVTQPSASRTPALLPMEPQNTLPSFYPSYSPAAHPSIPSEIPLQYFPNQMFTSPSADKSGTAPLNNRFGSILSPPRPVGFAQAGFQLLTDIAPMPIANSSGITPHLSNFNLTSLFPEIATAMPPDGSSMPMSPLLSLANTASSDSTKQSNRPAHNISHILGHDGTSAV